MAKIVVLESNKKMTEQTQVLLDKIAAMQSDSIKQIARAKKLESELTSRLKEIELKKAVKDISGVDAENVKTTENAKITKTETPVNNEVITTKTEVIESKSPEIITEVVVDKKVSKDVNIAKPDEFNKPEQKTEMKTEV